MKYFIKPALLLLTGIAVTATSCLKDDAFENGVIQSMHSDNPVKVVELKLTANDASNFLVYGVDNIDKDTVINLVPVNLATKDPAPEDLHVTLSLDSSLISNYNSNNKDDETDYSIPPASMYSIDSLVITIPKGSHTGYVKLMLNPKDYLGGAWALGFRIESIREPGYTISGNFNTGITVIAVKNEWDGIYAITGVLSGDNAYTGSTIDDKVALKTVNSNTVREGDIAAFFGGSYTDYTFNDDGTVGVGAFETGGGSYGASVISSSYDKDTHNFAVKFSILSGKYVFDLQYTRQ